MFEIIMKQDGIKYYLNSADAVYNFLERRGYDETLYSNGISVAIEVEGWCELAYIGEEFDYDDFIITCCDG